MENKNEIENTEPLIPEMDKKYILSGEQKVEDTPGPCKVFVGRVSDGKYVYFHSSGDAGSIEETTQMHKANFNNIKRVSIGGVIAVYTGRQIKGSVSELYDRAPKYQTFGGNRT